MRLKQISSTLPADRESYNVDSLLLLPTNSKPKYPNYPTDNKIPTLPRCRRTTHHHEFRLCAGVETQEEKDYAVFQAKWLDAFSDSPHGCSTAPDVDAAIHMGEKEYFGDLLENAFKAKTRQKRCRSGSGCRWSGCEFLSQSVEKLRRDNRTRFWGSSSYNGSSLEELDPTP